MRIKSPVKVSTNNTKHYIGSVSDGVIERLHRIPDPIYVEIVEDDSGYFLFRYDAEGNCLSDSWFEDLEHAKRQANFEYGIEENDWRKVE